MKALITGCSGFLGSHLAEFLLSRGYAVHGLVHHPSSAHNVDAFRHRVSLVECDVRRREEVVRAITAARPDEIYHLASVTSPAYSLEHPQPTYETNFLGALNVLDVIRQSVPSARVLYMSTALVYKDNGSGHPLSEGEATDPQTPYAASKAYGELLARQYYTNFGLHVVTARPFNSIGPRQSVAFACSNFARQIVEVVLRRRSPVLLVGDISRQRDFTDARDLARALWLLLQKGQAGEVYNVCTGTPHALKEVIQVLANIAGVVIKVQVDRHRLRRLDPPRIVGDPSKLQKQTGWQTAISFLQSLKDLFEHWKSVAATRSEVES